jgi:hypothetical protein
VEEGIMRTIGMFLFTVFTTAVGCTAGQADVAETGETQAPQSEAAVCGGPDGAPCADGLACVEDASGKCDSKPGDADCPGTCVEIPASPQFCGGFGNLPCPDGMVCVDDPRDDCAPPRGADCGGICVSPP